MYYYYTNMINDNTIILDSKIYKTIGELKQAPKKDIFRYVGIMKQSPIRDYLDKYFFEKYFCENKLTNNLTNRIRHISNKLCYREIIRRCFDNYDLISNNNKTEKKILSEEVILLINKMHEISSSNTGIFIDYLIRRIICEIKNDPFYDNRANSIICGINSNNILYKKENEEIYQFIINDKCNIWCISKEPNLKSETIGYINMGDCFIGYEKINEWLKIKYQGKYQNIYGYIRWKIPNCVNFNETDLYNEYIENKYIIKQEHNTSHICNTGCKYIITNYDFSETILPICQNLSYEKMKDINYKAYDIMKEIFIVSLSHSISFGGCCNQFVFDLFMNELNNIQNNKKIYEELYLLCKELLYNKENILLNPALGGLFKNSIPADCDIVLDDLLLDIKCTKNNNDIYELLQLLGYSSLLYYNPKYNININKIGLLNLLQGKYITYDISSCYSDTNLKNYLDLLNNNLIFSE